MSLGRKKDLVNKLAWKRTLQNIIAGADPGYCQERWLIELAPAAIKLCVLIIAVESIQEFESFWSYN